jgi:hypothetical protein
MAFTPYAGNELPNLVTIAKRLDPEGKIATIAELLTQFNPILEDIPVIEGNLPTGHRTTVRSDLPQPTWRRLNYGVRPTKSTTAQVDETLGMLEDYSEIDKDLAMLNGNTAEFRLSEDTPHLESMSQTMAQTMFYGDTATHPDRFLGLAPRYDTIGFPQNKPEAEVNSDYLQHIIDCGGTTAGAQTSVWFVVWGENTVHGIYPKGSKVGLNSEDLGEVTLFDNDGGRFQGYRTHYQWKMGMVVRDWRYIVRVANVELSMMDDAAMQKNLYTAMIKAKYAVPNGAMGRGVFYASPAVHALLDLAALSKENAALGYNDVFGKQVLSFRGTPIRPVSALLETEEVVTAP